MLRSRYPVLPFLLAALAILAIAFVTLRDSFDSPAVHNALWAPGSVGRGGAAGAPGVGVLAEQRLLAGDNGAVAGINVGGVAARVAHGGVIMPKLPNATAKYAGPPCCRYAVRNLLLSRSFPLRSLVLPLFPRSRLIAPYRAELGQASWKLLHTMAARFPEEPTDDEREAFKSYLYLFSRLYPCGEVRPPPPPCSNCAGDHLLILVPRSAPLNFKPSCGSFHRKPRLEVPPRCGSAAFTTSSTSDSASPNLIAPLTWRGCTIAAAAISAKMSWTSGKREKSGRIKVLQARTRKPRSGRRSS